MLKRRGLQALAEAMADIGAEQGMDEEETVAAASYVVKRLRGADAVTANFNQDRFDAAVRAAFRGE